MCERLTGREMFEGKRDVWKKGMDLRKKIRKYIEKDFS